MSSNKEFNVSLTRTAKHEEQICVRIDRNAYHAFMKKAMSEALGVDIGEGYRIDHQPNDVQITWTVTKKDAVPTQFFNLIDPFNKQTPSPSGEQDISPVGLTWNQLWRWLYSNYGYQQLANELIDRGFMLNGSVTPKANWDRASKHVRESIAIDFYKQHGSPEQVELSREEKLEKISEMYSSAHAFQTMIRIEPEFLVGKDVQLIEFEGVRNVSISEDKDFSFMGQLQPGAGGLIWHYFNAEDIEPMKDWDWTQKLKTSQVNALFTALK